MQLNIFPFTLPSKHVREPTLADKLKREGKGSLESVFSSSVPGYWRNTTLQHGGRCEKILLPLQICEIYSKVTKTQ